MRRFIIISIIIFSSFVCSAQSRWSVNAGYLVSQLSASDMGLSFSFDFNGFTMGVAYDSNTQENSLKFSTGVNWDIKTAKAMGLSNTYHYIRIPVHAKYDFATKGTAKLFVAAGPSVNVGITSDKVEFDEGDSPKRVFLQLGLLAGLEFSGRYIVKIGYDFGVTKFQRVTYTTRCNAFNLGVGYRF